MELEVVVRGPPEADEVFVFKTLIFQCICYDFAWNDVRCLSCFCCAYVHGFTVRIFSPAIAGHGQHPTSAWVVLPSQQKITVVALILQCYVRLSVAVCLSSSVTLCIVAKLCVLEQKLLLRAYKMLNYGESIGTKMNDVGLCLEVVLRSCQPLHHIHH